MGLSRGRSAALIALAVALAGCGSSDDPSPRTVGVSGPPGQQPSEIGQRYVERAEAVCGRGLREIRALGRELPRILSAAPSPQEGITNGLVKPGIGILSRESADLRQLGPPPDSPTLKIYLGLFEPIVELARQRVEAAAAQEPERAHDLELMIARLSDEQSAAARQSGLGPCGVDFTSALGGSG
jgi:hypothetical protein